MILLLQDLDEQRSYMMHSCVNPDSSGSISCYLCILPDAYLCQHCTAVTVCTIFMSTKQCTNYAMECVEQYVQLVRHTCVSPQQPRCE